jgi:hypothetical protein
MKDQQRVDPELAWVVRWRETGEERTPPQDSFFQDKIFTVCPVILASRVPYEKVSFSALFPCLPPPDYPG